ncbi:transposase, partial [Limosilactobacillus reuteri]|uniref:transposase n=1 Tax=Limosilactobacillus reuteri TaxID=1598 RepID=UPI003F9B3152
NYHLVMVVKYRRKVINDEISEYLKHRFVVVRQAYGINLQEWNHDDVYPQSWKSTLGVFYMTKISVKTKLKAVE